MNDPAHVPTSHHAEVMPHDYIPTTMSASHTKASTILAGMFFIVVVVGVGGYYVGQRSAAPKNQINSPGSWEPTGPPVKTESPSPEARACTMEAKLCPDGSSVGRTGPNCEFAECPISAKKVMVGEWITYQSKHYPYQLSYPDMYEYLNRDPGQDTYAGYKEQAFFQKGAFNSDIDAFYVYVSKNSEPLNMVFDQPATGKYVLNGIDGVYGELPGGYGDGAGYNPPPMLVVQVSKDGTLYKIIFLGISSINDSLAQQILDRFQFTD